MEYKIALLAFDDVYSEMALQEFIKRKQANVLDSDSVFSLYERIAVETSLLLEENERTCLL